MAGAITPIRNGVLETDLDLNGFALVNLSGAGFQPHSTALDTLADSSALFLTLSAFTSVAGFKNQLDLGSVDNTSDASKPVSTAQQAALDLKVPTSRTINGYPLTGNVTLSLVSGDLGVAPSVLGINFLTLATPATASYVKISHLDSIAYVTSSDLLNEIIPTQTGNAGRFLTTDGATLSWAAFDADLTSWAAVTRASGFDTFATTPTLANLKSLVTDETTVGWNLLTLPNPSAVTFLQLNADNSVTAQSASAQRTALSLVVGTNVQAWDADLDSWAAITRASGFDTFTATPSSVNLKALLTDETGSGALVFATSPTLVTPVLGAATATSLTLTNGGAITDGGTGAITLTASGTNQNITISPSGTGTTNISGGYFSYASNTSSATIPTTGFGMDSVAWLRFKFAGADVFGASGSGSIKLVLPTAGVFAFSSTTSIAGSPDFGIARNAAGVGELNSGTAGTYRDLKLRTLLPGGGATVTVSTPMVDGSQTWNDAAVTFTGVKYNVTSTASASASKLLDLQVGAVSKLIVQRDGSVGSFGNIGMTGILGFNNSDPIGNIDIAIQRVAGPYLRVTTDQGSINGIIAAASYYVGATDTILTRDAANTLALRNSANAQALNVYNTYTDANNNWKLQIVGNFAASGHPGITNVRTVSGSANSAADLYIDTPRTLILSTAATGRWKVDTNGHFIAAVDNTTDIGLSGATRPRDFFLSRNAVIGGTLSVTGHTTFEGVTSTGATGTGKLVYDTSPTLVTPALGVATATSLAASGVVTGSNIKATVIGASVYHNASQSVSNTTSTALAFNSERWDTDTMHDTVTNNGRIVCKTAGKFSVQASVEWAGNAAGSRELWIRRTIAIGGAVSIISDTGLVPSIGAGAMVQNTPARVFDFAVNDYIEVFTYQSSGGALNVNFTDSYSPEVTMVWLGP